MKEIEKSTFFQKCYSESSKHWFPNFFKRISFLYLLVDFCFYIIQKLKLCPYRLCLTNPFLTPEKLTSHNVFFRCYRKLQYFRVQFLFFFSRHITYCKPTSETELMQKLFSEPWGMNSTIVNVKQVFRYKFGIFFKITRSNFSHAFFLFSF